MKTPTAFHHSAQRCRRLRWVMRQPTSQPQRGCIPSAAKRYNPVGVENHFESLTQGSHVAPTLGWMTLPRWGKPNCV